MKHTKYRLESLIEPGTNKVEPMNINLPMNRPVMLVRINDKLVLKRLRNHSLASPKQLTVTADQVRLL